MAGKLAQVGPGTFVVAHAAEDIANSVYITQKERGFRDYFAQLPVAPECGVYIIIGINLPQTTDPQFARQLSRLLDDDALHLKGVFVSTLKAYEIAPYLQAYHREDIRLIGYDLLEKPRFINEMVINFLIKQNPRKQGYRGTEVCMRWPICWFLKKEVAPLRYLSLDIITKENLQYYLRK